MKRYSSIVFQPVIQGYALGLTSIFPTVVFPFFFSGMSKSSATCAEEARRGSCNCNAFDGSLLTTFVEGPIVHQPTRSKLDLRVREHAVDAGYTFDPYDYFIASMRGLASKGAKGHTSIKASNTRQVVYCVRENAHTHTSPPPPLALGSHVKSAQCSSRDVGLLNTHTCAYVQHDHKLVDGAVLLS